MDSLFRPVLIACALWLAAPGVAWATSFVWTYGPNSGSAQQMCDAYSAASGYWTGGTPDAGTPAYPTGVGQYGYCGNYHDPYGNSSGPGWVRLVSVGCGASGQPACPPPPGCSLPSGTSAGDSRSILNNGSAPPTMSYCDAASQCLMQLHQVVEVSVSSGTAWTATGTYTTQSCPTGTASGGTVQATPACVTGASGLQYCSNPSGGGQCGELNGQFICLSNTPKGGCQKLGDGSMACDSKAGTPPAPNNGTAGVPASPSGSLAQQTPSATSGAAVSNTYNSYSSTTVSGSVGGSGGTPVPAQGATGASGGTTGGGTATGQGQSCANGQTLASDGSGCQGDSISGGLGCVSPPVCTGDPVQCDQDYQAWKARCPGDALTDVTGAAGAAGTVPNTSVDVSSSLSTSGVVAGSSGACPAPFSINVAGMSLSVDLWSKVCEFAGSIGFIVLVVGYSVAGQIVLDALLK